MNLKDYLKAIDNYTKAYDIKQDYTDAFYNRGLVNNTWASVTLHARIF